MVSAFFLSQISVQERKCPAVCGNLVIEADFTVMLATCTFFILLLSQHTMMCRRVHIFHYQKLCALAVQYETRAGIQIGITNMACLASALLPK
jgi:hypothetical protein